MATLSARRLWTIYKRLAVEPGSSKRDLIRTRVAFYSGAPEVLKVLAYLIDRGEYVGASHDDHARGATAREDPGAPPARETPLSVKPQEPPGFVTPMSALAVKKLPEGDYH
jgi:hypothetical protein